MGASPSSGAVAAPRRRCTPLITSADRPTGSTHPTPSSGPLGEPVERGEHVGCVSGTVAGPVGELNEDPGFDERTEVAAWVTAASPGFQSYEGDGTGDLRTRLGGSDPAAGPDRTEEVRKLSAEGGCGRGNAFDV